MTSSWAQRRGSRACSPSASVCVALMAGCCEVDNRLQNDMAAQNETLGEDFIQIHWLSRGISYTLMTYHHQEKTLWMCASLLTQAEPLFFIPYALRCLIFRFHKFAKLARRFCRRLSSCATKTPVVRRIYNPQTSRLRDLTAVKRITGGCPATRALPAMLTHGG